MRTRIYIDGKPAWTDNEPARARVAGYGGSAMSHAITPLKVGPSSAVRTAAAQRGLERKRLARAKARTA